MESARKQGNRRKTGKEQYYTPPATASQVVKRLLEIAPHASERVWIEPAGGAGAFVDAAHLAGVNEVVSFDVEPRHPSVKRGDFLSQKLQLAGAVSIGNPPFGRNNALSVPFFNSCGEYSDLICFIVPKSWRKWSVINRLHQSFHLIDDYELNVNYEDMDGHDLSKKFWLNTVVQTWERRETPRGKIKVEDRGVVRRATPLTADVSLTIFGFGCGTLKTDFPRKPNTTQIFLTLHHDRALEALQSVDYSRFSRNTAYTAALSLQEINYLLNEYLFGDPGFVTSNP
ncbi:MAG: hypothetical protein ACO31D_02865 [Ilumatobacteraceae bacterium]